MQEYIITAYSPKLNTTQRELQLMGPQPSNIVIANQLAESFARRLSQVKSNGADDWVGRVESVEEDHYRTL